MSMHERSDVRLTEVGPRDGLQDVAPPVSTDAKVAFVESLASAGLPRIEVTSFVHPGRVPGMADAAEVFRAVRGSARGRLLALVPNVRGWERAREAGCCAFSVLTAGSEAFAEANLGMTVEQTFGACREVLAEAKQDGDWVRGTVSVAFGCPYSGPVAPEVVRGQVERLLDLGCAEVCLGDTTGTANPTAVGRLLDDLLKVAPASHIGAHFHDTWGMGLANVLAAVDRGVRSFDTSAGGLGGCPFTPGASGNVATEDVVHALGTIGRSTGVDIDAVVDAVVGLGPHLPMPAPGRVHQAILARRLSCGLRMRS